MAPSDVEQVRAALRALLLRPEPTNFDRACALIEALPTRRRAVPVGVRLGDVTPGPPCHARELGRN